MHAEKVPNVSKAGEWKSSFQHLGQWPGIMMPFYPLPFALYPPHTRAHLYVQHAHTYERERKERRNQTKQNRMEKSTNATL